MAVRFNKSGFFNYPAISRSLTSGRSRIFRFAKFRDDNTSGYGCPFYLAALRAYKAGSKAVEINGVIPYNLIR